MAGPTGPGQPEAGFGLPEVRGWPRSTGTVFGDGLRRRHHPRTAIGTKLLARGREGHRRPRLRQRYSLAAIHASPASFVRHRGPFRCMRLPAGGQRVFGRCGGTQFPRISIGRSTSVDGAPSTVGCGDDRGPAGRPGRMPHDTWVFRPIIVPASVQGSGRPLLARVGRGGAGPLAGGRAQASFPMMKLPGSPVPAQSGRSPAGVADLKGIPQATAATSSSAAMTTQHRAWWARSCWGAKLPILARDPALVIARSAGCAMSARSAAMLANGRSRQRTCRR